MRDLLARMFVSQLGHPECAVAALLTCFPHVVAVFDITHFDALLPAIKNIYDSDAFYPSVLKVIPVIPIAFLNRPLHLVTETILLVEPFLQLYYSITSARP